MTQLRHGYFPTTDWGLFADLRGRSPHAKRAALDILIRRYWRPVFAFLRHNGQDEESAKDTTQAFFAAWIADDVFSKADREKGRFRSFLLSCLKRFTANEHRAEHALKRRPKAGLASLDEMMANPDRVYEPKDATLTPDQVFDRAWACEVIMRVLKHLATECQKTGKQVHYDVFRRRIIDPILHGATAPALADVGQEHGLTEKQAANHLETAKRAYRRLMEEEIRLYAASEAEIDEEVRELFRVMGN